MFGCTVGELQARMSSSEFTEWVAYDRIEPFGPTREDERIGTLVALLYNINRKKGAKSLIWSDIFKPYNQRKPQTWQDQLSIVEMLNEAFGGKDLRGNKETLSS